MNYLPVYIVGNLKELKKILSSKKEGYLFLDDRYFNKNKVLGIEKYLRQEGIAYYYNRKSDLLYDQFEIFKKDVRIRGSLPLPIKLIKRVVEPYPFSTFPYISKSLCKELLDGDFLFFAKQARKEIEYAESFSTY